MTREGLNPSIDVKRIAKKAGLASIAASSLVLPTAHINADNPASTPKAIFQSIDIPAHNQPVFEFRTKPQATITGTDSVIRAAVDSTPVSTETPTSTSTPTAIMNEAVTTVPTEKASATSTSTLAESEAVNTPEDTATPTPTQEATEQAANESLSHFKYVLEGDEILNKELYSHMVFEEIKTEDALKTHIEQIKGKGYVVPEFDPESQIAFIAAITSENYKPAFKLEGMKEVDGETVIDLSYASQTTDSNEEYDADERNSYVIGIIDKPIDKEAVKLQASFVDSEGPFITTTIGKFEIDGGFSVTVPGVASGNLDECFGSSMTEIRELQKQYPTAASVEFQPQYDQNGALLGWSWNFVTASGEKFAWNDFAKAPHCPDARP